jgi:hypothetical protein
MAIRLLIGHADGSFRTIGHSGKGGLFQFKRDALERCYCMTKVVDFKDVAGE